MVCKDPKAKMLLKFGMLKLLFCDPKYDIIAIAIENRYL